MIMNFNVVLFKDLNCDLCKLMQQELMDNPPAADVTICHVKHSYNKELVIKNKIKEFPTIIVYHDEKEIARRTGFIDSKIIDNIIKKYETEHMV